MNEQEDHSPRAGEHEESGQITLSGVVCFIDTFYDRHGVPFTKFKIEVHEAEDVRKVTVIASGREMSNLARNIYRGQAISVTGQQIVRKRIQRKGESNRKFLQAIEINFS